MDTLVTIILADALICQWAPRTKRPLAKHTQHRKGGIAQLVERRPCNWVVVFAGWMLSLLSGNDSIVYPNQWLTFSQKWGRGL